MKEKKDRVALSDLLSAELLYSWEKGPLAGVGAEIAMDSLDLVAKVGKRPLDRPGIIKLVHVLAIERVTHSILGYLNNEIVEDRHDNPLTSLTACTPSENKLVNVGASALSVLLAYHTASHYLLGEMLLPPGQGCTSMNDEQVRKHIESKCQMLPFTFELLAKHIPESVGSAAPTADPKTLN